ncbi:hypothetical protein V8B97DRAFT_1875211, partial [Scleroderma yunnanense]
VEIQNAQKVDSAQLTIGGQQYNIARGAGDVFREVFNSALVLSSQEPFTLSITYQKRFFRQKPSEEISINPQDVLSKSQDLKYRQPHRKLVIVLDDLVPHAPGRRHGEPSTPTSDGQLIPTTDELLKQCPHFRILVMGKSGVGKTSLINRTFGIKAASAEHERRGKTDIYKELISETNTRFILHDSNGFEPGENDNLAVVREFIDKRKNHQDIKEQLHAVWLSFQIPLEAHGQRMMETGMEHFLRDKRKILGDIPTVFVFTKYDKLTEMIESNWVDSRRDYNPADIEAEAKKYLVTHCVQPIQNLTSEPVDPYIAVSTKIRYKARLTQLIQLTHDKVSEYSEANQGTGPSPVPTVTIMAQRVSPLLKIDESINVGKRRYWQAVVSGADFPGLKIRDCLGVIHTDVVKVWNFWDPSEMLDSAFRDGMLELVSLLDDPASIQPRPPKRSNTIEAMENDSLALVALIPVTAAFSIVKWAYNTYYRLPDVQRKFMAYIVDLTHVLDILFTLTAGKSEQALAPQILQRAIALYRESGRSTYVHDKIKSFPVSVFSSNQVILEIECLVRERYVKDDELRKHVEAQASKDKGGK